MRMSAYKILYLKFLMWDIWEREMPVKIKPKSKNK